MASTQHNACFTIEGAFLADHARDRVREGDWERALKLLTEDLEGMTYELAIAILKGEADLTGSSADPQGIGFKQLPADGPLALQMREQLQYLYGGTFRFKDRYWKPYARVTSWDGDDRLFAISEPSGNIFSAISFRDLRGGHAVARRSLFYANNRSRDMLVIFRISDNQDAFILCEEAKMPPLWFDVPVDTPDRVLSKMLEKGLVLEERGASGAEKPTGSVCSFDDAKRKALKSTLRSKKQLAREEQEQKQQDERSEQYRKDRLLRITQEVKAQAEQKGGLYPLKLKDKRGKPYAKQPVLMVPRNPFLLWALRNFDFESFDKERPEWDVVSPIGLKMPFDDPYHSDWVLGAGLELDEVYDRQEESLTSIAMMSAVDEQFSLVSEWTQMDFVTLAWPGEPAHFSGEVVIAKPNQPVKPGSIAIAEHAGPEYQFAMETACTEDAHGSKGLIICATGGKLAHLAVVGREYKCTVLMIPDAVKKYKGTQTVSVNMNTGKIRHIL